MSKLICGFEKLNEGKIYFNQKDLSELTIAERAKHIGYVLQNPNQMISKSLIFDEVALGLRSRDYSEQEIREKVEKNAKDLWTFPF